MAITKLDVLDGFDEIKVCTGYKLGNKEIKYIPNNITDLKSLVPIYTTFKGWKTNTSNIKDYKDLPVEMIEYLDFIKNYTGVDIKIISVGPSNDQTIMKDFDFILK